MNVLIIQPPLVQLNTVYPSGAYLSAFFRSQGCSVKWYDLSIELFHRIFCKESLIKLFEKTSLRALDMADRAERNGDEATAFELRRYVYSHSAWENWIDSIVSILHDSSSEANRALCHNLMLSPHAPRGHRMENFLEGLERMPGVDDARMLATMALADLSDYISMVFDSEFSLVRYGERLTVNETVFSQIEKGVDSPVLKDFYEPMLEEIFCGADASATQKIFSGTEKTIVCISVPFAGTFSAALCTGRFFKKHFGDKVFVSFGGGFVNTELRETKETALSKYCDALSYDRGYGSYRELLEFLQDARKTPVGAADILCAQKTFYEPAVAEPTDIPRSHTFYKLRLFMDKNISDCTWHNPSLEKFEDEQTCTLIPDYTDIDFSRYLSMADDINPMQRIWSDGTWLKAYLAHGCYWHQCAFCDVTLDYVSSYRPTKTSLLYEGLLKQTRAHKLTGIHFVDEALPPVQLAQFASLNAHDGTPLTYWGNIRFEKTFTRDLADFLSYGGLLGVSGGIEIATGKGLESIHKGTDLNSIVASCCAFKEAGILVHAYLIYGWWCESDQDIINSMETLRQFYELGLLDSSFWHKFVLTRHSRVYSEWKEGKYPELVPVEPKNAGLFAKNGLHFKGEEKSEKFGDGLNAALNAWMHGEALKKNVCRWFNFKTPEPTVPKNLVSLAVERYEKMRDDFYASEFVVKKMWWLGGEPLCILRGNKKIIAWTYMQESHEVFCTDADKIYEFLIYLSPQKKNVEEAEKIFAFLSESDKKVLRKLRGAGLVQLAF